MIDISFVSGNIRNEKSARLWNLFYQIKNGTGFWQGLKDQQKRIRKIFRHDRPHRCKRYVLGMNQC